ncbi:MAK10-like protein [Tanacetum coccineum]
MGDENPIRTLGDYSKPSHEGYRNTIELPVGNNVVPLRSDTIRLVQNGCSFHGLWSEDPNQHLKDFLKLVDSLDLDGRTAKLRNDILMFQQHHSESLSEAWTRFKELLQKVPHHGIDLWLQVQIFYGHVNPATRRTIDQSVGGKLHDRNAEESWALLEDRTLYDNESWNDPRDFAKPVKEIALSQDVPNTSDCHLIELENQICSGSPHASNCMEDPEQAFVEYASSRIDEAGEGLVSNFMESQDDRLSKFEANFKQQQNKMTNKIDTMLKAITDRIAGALPSDTVKNPKLSTSLVLSGSFLPNNVPQCTNTMSMDRSNVVTINPKQQKQLPNDDRTENNEEEEKVDSGKYHVDPSNATRSNQFQFITEKVLN